eukprot:COSAG02_NODE_18347_length_944_cov_3.556088_1_plen_28_part_10
MRVHSISGSTAPGLSTGTREDIQVLQSA